MVQLVCQRCGESNEHDDLKEAKFKLKHGKGCGSKIGIVVVSGKATATASVIAEPPKVEETITPEEEPKPKKKTSKKKKSE